MTVNSVSFMRWLGHELQRILRENKNGLGPQRDLVAQAVPRLDKMSTGEKKELLQLFLDSHKTRLIGDFKIRYDLRDEADFYDDVVSFLEAYLDRELT